MRSSARAWNGSSSVLGVHLVEPGPSQLVGRHRGLYCTSSMAGRAGRAAIPHERGERDCAMAIFLLILLAAIIPVESVQAQDAQDGSPLVEDAVFTNGEITLAGRLYLPLGAGPFPAVVFTHGSGPSGRDNPRYDEEAREFVRSGIACLLYDKRGVGASTGDWRTASFEDLAGDALVHNFINTLTYLAGSTSAAADWGNPLRRKIRCRGRARTSSSYRLLRRRSSADAQGSIRCRIMWCSVRA